MACAVLLAPGGNEITEAAQGLWPQLLDICLHSCARSAHPKMHGTSQLQQQQQQQPERRQQRFRLSHATCEECAEGGAPDRWTQRSAMEYTQISQESIERLSLWRRSARAGAMVVECVEPHGFASPQRGHGLSTILVRLRSLLISASGCSSTDTGTDRSDTTPCPTLSTSHGTGNHRIGDRADPSHWQDSQFDWRRGRSCDWDQSQCTAHVLSARCALSNTYTHLQYTLVSGKGRNIKWRRGITILSLFSITGRTAAKLTNLANIHT